MTFYEGIYIFLISLSFFVDGAILTTKTILYIYIQYYIYIFLTCLDKKLNFCCNSEFHAFSNLVANIIQFTLDIEVVWRKLRRTLMKVKES